MSYTEAAVRAMLEGALDKFDADFGTPIQAQVEMIRSEVQRVYDLEYEAGMIDKKPNVTAEWNPETQAVDVHLSWPIEVLECRFVYSNNAENSAIDSPLDKP